MKIRNPHVISAASWLGAKLVRCWTMTNRCGYHALEPKYDPRRGGIDGRCIYAFWHENMLMPLSRFGRPDIRVLISTHADGQLIAELARHLGFGLVRGSSTREGIKAVREMLRIARNADIAVTPDGPQGPRRVVQPGLVYLASRTGLPIVPAGVGYSRAWLMNSWDRFAIPRPFSFMTWITGLPITVPADARREELESYRLRVEQAIGEMSDLAEGWAETGVRSQGSGVRGQGSGIRNQESGVRGQESGIRNQESGVRGQESESLEPEEENKKQAS